MDQRSFFLLAGVIFTSIALLHLLRIIYGWDSQLRVLVDQDRSQRMRDGGLRDAAQRVY